MREESNQVALWVLRAQCGDREALELLLRHVQPLLRRYLTGLVVPSDADDALQEALLLIYRKLKSLEAPELFRPWAFRIASRAGLRHIKKRRHWSEHVQAQDSLGHIPAANASFDAEGLRELLATNQISPACSAVLTLYFEEQMTLAEVAEALEIPLGTVKSRLAYGLAALRKRLGDRRNY
jgi:RNA polymerase sigma-70 factor, ECF subfamily